FERSAGSPADVVRSVGYAAVIPMPRADMRMPIPMAAAMDRSDSWRLGVIGFASGVGRINEWSHRNAVGARAARLRSVNVNIRVRRCDTRATARKLSRHARDHGPSRVDLRRIESMPREAGGRGPGHARRARARPAGVVVVPHVRDRFALL